MRDYASDAASNRRTLESTIEEENALESQNILKQKIDKLQVTVQQLTKTIKAKDEALEYTKNVTRAIEERVEMFMKQSQHQSECQKLLI